MKANNLPPPAPYPQAELNLMPTCQPVEQKTIAQSLRRTLSLMKATLAEVCQIELADLDTGYDNILPVHIGTFLAFAL